MTPAIRPVKDDPDERYYTTAYIARLLDVQVETVRDWVKTGKLRGGRFGRHYRVARSDFITFARAMYGDNKGDQ